MSEHPVAAELVENRAVVWNNEGAMRLYADGYYGQPVGIRKPKTSQFDKPLELSLLECAYLTEKKRISVTDTSKRRILSVKDIVELGMTVTDAFQDQFYVYSELRNLGYVVRPGLKFGTDFAVYERGPGLDHAPFLVHVIAQKNGVAPLDIVRAGRLATSVRKKFIIATVKENGKIAYYSFVWHRP